MSERNVPKCPQNSAVVQMSQIPWAMQVTTDPSAMTTAAFVNASSVQVATEEEIARAERVGVLAEQLGTLCRAADRGW